MRDIRPCWLQDMVVLGVMSVLVVGAYARDVAKPSLMPTIVIPGLSPQQRQKMYAVRITDARDAGIDPKTRTELEWPSKSDIGGKLYKDVTAKRRPAVILNKWLPNFVKLPKGISVKVMVEKGRENLYCLLGPPDASFRLRLWQPPLDKTAWRPKRIDLLVSLPADRSMVNAALGEMLSIKDKKGTPLADLKNVVGMLKLFPMQDSFVDLPWKVGGVTRMFGGHVVRAEFLVGGPRRPLLMRLYIGNKGAQVSIQGNQLRGVPDPDVFEPLRRDAPPLLDTSAAGVARQAAKDMLAFLSGVEESNPWEANDYIYTLGELGARHVELAPSILKGLEESRARVAASKKLSDRDRRGMLRRYDWDIAHLRKAMKATHGSSESTGTQDAPTTQPAATPPAATTRPAVR